MDDDELRDIVAVALDLLLLNTFICRRPVRLAAKPSRAWALQEDPFGCLGTPPHMLSCPRKRPRCCSWGKVVRVRLGNQKDIL